MSVGKNIPTDSAKNHVTGASIFIDDRTPQKDELYVGYVGSPIACGEILEINFEDAKKVPGFHSAYIAKDLTHNKWGTIVKDQPILADKIVNHYDEPVCIIAAESREALRQAKSKVHIKITPHKASFSIDEAISEKKFLYQAVPLKSGNSEEKLKNSPHRLQGTFDIGGQEHFYLESQASIAYPLEGGMIEVHSSSQHPTETQHVCAHALGLSFHQVVCVVKRMGGGFGGKESQAAPFAAMAALVAQKTKKAARIVLSKDEDMQTTGKRHPFKIFYDVGFDDNGKVIALEAKLYADGGAYTDLSPSILDRALFHMDGIYFLESSKLEGWVCKTNRSSNTAFRGFGGPQGTLAMENILEEIAQALKLDAQEVRRKNIYQKEKNNITPFGQKVEANLLPDLFEKVLSSAEYEKRKHEIQKFNFSNNDKTRGISCTGVKFGIAFTAKHLNQGSALVHILTDGTVQVSTGATEMGQGVNTKIAQVVASTLNLAADQIKVLTTSTEKNANTSPTAASSGTDINAAAAEKACKLILERLSDLKTKIKNKSKLDDEFFPHIENIEELSWRQLVDIAYRNRISLSELAHFKTEGIGFDKKSGKGTPFKYFTQGVALTEVEIDNFTGQSKVLRVDLIMDLGQMINPGIDSGQVTGAFIQGMGWVTSENLFYGENGKLISHSPTTYKIPNIQDTPRIFNISFMDNPEHKENIFRSKAVGEPPFLLSSSVFTALKNAIYNRTGKMSRISSPATPECILFALDADK